MANALKEKMPEWMARGIVPDEAIPEGNKTLEPIRYGMTTWKDMFSPRQLYGHCTSVEVFQELVEECGGQGNLSDLDKAAFTYIALALDKMLNYNSRMSVWMPTREVVANTFNRHDFAFCWSYAEMAPTIAGLGYDWAFEQTGKALAELMKLMGHDLSDLHDETEGKKGVRRHKQQQFNSEIQTRNLIPPEIFNRSADALPEVGTASVDIVVMDPPYYDNVMYAELSDFFYVWLKRTAGLLFPGQFSDHLTDKDREAVANPAKFRDFTQVAGSGGARKRATRDYQERMQAIFAECRRVLKKDGLMVLMFTHKATGAWDALAMGLLAAGFEITASWPINTEAEGSLHIKDKNAAKSTIFLVCRPREDTTEKTETTYWEEVEPLVTRIVRQRVQKFQDAGIGGVDLYLSCFGPALQEFSRHWPMQRGRAMQKPEPQKGAQLKLFEDEDWDPYAVRPEDALNAARIAVKDWRLEQLATVQRQAHLDPVTEFFVLAWDAFKSPQFPADEALKLARVVGISFDEKLRNKILELKGSDVILWDSALRSRKGSIGDIHNVGLNALHVAANLGREQNTGISRDYLERMGVLKDAAFMRALETVLNVLPPPQSLESGKSGPLRGAAADCEALEKLRRLAFATEIPPPRQGVYAIKEGKFVPNMDL
jgi:putative DNA methylase